MGCFGGCFGNFMSFENYGVLIVGLGGVSVEMGEKMIKGYPIMSS